MTVLFDLREVSVKVGNTSALRDCSLCIHAGQRLALVGANGCGKSSLLRVFHGVLKPTAGNIAIAPLSVQAMVFQRPYLLRASVLQNVALGMWLRGTHWTAAKVQALQALERLGIEDLCTRNARALSLGQQHRVALARAWAFRPQVMLLDEPTASLDPSGKHEVERLMAEFADSGMTLIFSSHNLGQVKRLASRVIYLEHGRIVADLPTHDFFNGPLPIAAENFLKGES